MSIYVGIVGDAVAEPVANWTDAPPTYVPGSKITVDGDYVITSATVVFTYTGIPPPPPGTTETVTVTPNPTLLKDSGNDLLVDGDEKTGPFGNKVKIVTSQELLSTV